MLKSVQLLVEAGANLDECSKYGQFALITACEINRRDLVAYLVGKGANVNIIDRKGSTPLLAACSCRAPSKAIVKLLIDAGADANFSDINGKTPLALLELKKASSELMDVLIQAGATPTPKTRNVKAKTETRHSAIEIDGKISAKSAKLAKMNVGNVDPANFEAFLEVCKTGDLKDIKYFVENGAEVTRVNYDGWNPRCPLEAGMLHYEPSFKVIKYLVDQGAKITAWCFFQASLQCIKYFVENGVDVNAADPSDSNYTPFTALCFKDHWDYDKLEYMIKHGADVNARYSRTPAMIKVIEKQLKFNSFFELVELFVRAGANINMSGGEYYATALLLACQGGQPADKIKLLIESGADVSVKDAWGYTPLHYACRGDYQMEMIDLIIASGFTRYGTSLRAALFSKKPVEMIRRFVKAGADPNAIDEDGRNVLFYAIISHSSMEVLKLLAELGVDFNAIDKFQENALFHAFASGHAPVERIKFLIESGTDPNHCSDRGSRPLHIACLKLERIERELVELLLQYGADINATNSEGNTPLSLCIHKLSLEDLKYFLSFGARLDLQGKDPLLARACGRSEHSDVIGFLIEQGHDVNAANKDGRTPFAIMCSNPEDRFEDIKMLLEAGADVKVKVYNKLPLARVYEKKKIPIDLFKLLVDYGAESDCSIINSYSDPWPRVRTQYIKLLLASKSQ